MIARNIVTGLVIGVVFYILAVYAGVKIKGDVYSFITVYHDNMRGYLFSAFLGISSFLLSLLTFVVINLKEKMFDSEDYLNIYAKHSSIFSGEQIRKGDLYKPLVVITGALVMAIFSCIVTALLQFTLGFSNNKWILILPTIFPFFALSYMCISLFQMTQLIFQWLRADGFIKAP
ncbi:hypothetical protein [Serratia sp. CY37869]|uniref:hypothetical protein n=1 Tax=Serratia sp. CY37869 TaxID=3383612 RepID=UPI003F9ED68D